MNLRTRKRRACAGMARRIDLIASDYPAPWSWGCVLSHMTWRPSEAFVRTYMPDRVGKTIIRIRRWDRRVCGYGSR